MIRIRINNKEVKHNQTGLVFDLTNFNIENPADRSIAYSFNFTFPLKDNREVFDYADILSNSNRQYEYPATISDVDTFFVGKFVVQNVDMLGNTISGNFLSYSNEFKNFDKKLRDLVGTDMVFDLEDLDAPTPLNIWSELYELFQKYNLDYLETEHMGKFALGYWSPMNRVGNPDNLTLYNTKVEFEWLNPVINFRYLMGLISGYTRIDDSFVDVLIEKYDELYLTPCNDFKYPTKYLAAEFFVYDKNRFSGTTYANRTPFSIRIGVDVLKDSSLSLTRNYAKVESALLPTYDKTDNTVDYTSIFYGVQQYTQGNYDTTQLIYVCKEDGTIRIDLNIDKFTNNTYVNTETLITFDRMYGADFIVFPNDDEYDSTTPYYNINTNEILGFAFNRTSASGTGGPYVNHTYTIAPITTYYLDKEEKTTTSNYINTSSEKSGYIIREVKKGDRIIILSQRPYVYGTVDTDNAFNQMFPNFSVKIEYVDAVSTVDFGRLLPDMTVKEFIDSVCKTFGLYLRLDTFQNKISLLDFNDLTIQNPIRLEHFKPLTINQNNFKSIGVKLKDFTEKDTTTYDTTLQSLFLNTKNLKVKGSYNVSTSGSNRYDVYYRSIQDNASDGVVVLLNDYYLPSFNDEDIKTYYEIDQVASSDANPYDPAVISNTNKTTQSTLVYSYLTKKTYNTLTTLPEVHGSAYVPTIDVNVPTDVNLGVYFDEYTPLSAINNVKPFREGTTFINIVNPTTNRLMLKCIDTNVGKESDASNTYLGQNNFNAKYMTNYISPTLTKWVDFKYDYSNFIRFKDIITVEAKLTTSQFKMVINRTAKVSFNGIVYICLNIKEYDTKTGLCKMDVASFV